VDTGAWFAVQVPRDRWHSEAAATLRSAVAHGWTLLTTNLVIGETFTLLRRTAGAASAWRFVDLVGQSPRTIAVHVDAPLEGDAWALLRRFEDHELSFVDGASFAVMQQRRLTRALAFGSDFRAAGFVRVPVDEPLLPV
jgi:uncharacterized protein